MARLPLLALLLSIPSPATAQWSKDPSNPQELAGGAGDQGAAQLVAGPGGSLFFSYLDAGAAKLQRLDAAGRTMWPAPVTLGTTTTTRLASDPSGNAWVSIADVGLTVFQFDAEGNQVWSHSLAAGNIYQHSLAVTETGHAVVAWADSNWGIVAQRLDPLGAPQWNPPFVVPPDPAFPFPIQKSSPRLAAVGGDAVVLAWSSGDGVFASDLHLHAQKLDVAGNALWFPDPVVVFEKGSLWGSVSVTSDGLGGAYLRYHDIDPFVGVFQRLLSDGTQSLGQPGEGMSLATLPNLPGGAHAALRPETNETYVVWTDKLFLDNEFTGDRGYSAQKFAPNGAPLWGSAGVVCVPVSDTTKSGAYIVPLPHGVAVAWMEEDQLRVLLLDENGAPQGEIIDVGDALDPKFINEVVAGAFGDLVALWQQASDVVGQNLTPSGNFGPAPGAVFRTAGPNPHSLTASVGPLGGDLELSVDLTTTGHEFATIVCYLAPAEIYIGGGVSGGDYALVLPVGPQLLPLPLLRGPTAEVTLPIPQLPILCGVTLYSQAVHIGSILPLRASNAQDLYFGL